MLTPDHAVFKENIFVIDELSKHAPKDHELLKIPRNVNIVDLFVNGKPFITYKLLHFMQAINRSLTRTYASYRHIIANQISIKRESSKDALSTNRQVYLDDMMIQSYEYSSREFVTMLRVAVDQLILLFTSGKCDCIGSFVKKLTKEAHNGTESQFDIKFLVGLNCTANYLKHHPYQFNDNGFNPNKSSIFVIASKKDRDFDYKNIRDYFKNELIHNNDLHVTCWITHEFFISGFNAFYQTIKSLI